MAYEISFKDCYDDQDDIKFSINSQGEVLISMKIKCGNEYINTSVSLDSCDLNSLKEFLNNFK